MSLKRPPSPAPVDRPVKRQKTSERALVVEGVAYQPALLPQPLAQQMFQDLLTGVAWADEVVRGRVAQRKVAAYGDEAKTYTYAGTAKLARLWTPPLLQLKDMVEEQVGVSFNYALLNLYRDGQDRIGYHSDDTSVLKPGHVIASVSLGAERDFLLKRKSDGELKTVALGPGNLLVMQGDTQKLWKHAVPPRKKVKEPRINITFRQIQD